MAASYSLYHVEVSQEDWSSHVFHNRRWLVSAVDVRLICNINIFTQLIKIAVSILTLVQENKGMLESAANSPLLLEVEEDAFDWHLILNCRSHL